MLLFNLFLCFLFVCLFVYIYISICLFLFVFVIVRYMCSLNLPEFKLFVRCLVLYFFFCIIRGIAWNSISPVSQVVVIIILKKNVHIFFLLLSYLYHHLKWKIVFKYLPFCGFLCTSTNGINR